MLRTRDKLLLYLKESKGSWVSGEWLSRQLAISRAAVNKHIGHLRRLGYPIETSTKKGYSLKEPWDLILPEEIREGLDTQVFGAGEIICLTETDSTNTRAKELATGGAAEGALVIAEKQTGGRGRKGRSWFSPEGGGVYLSLVLRPAMTPTEASRITLMTGVAAAEALRSTTRLEATIKWPNDILVGGKKIAGILTEISTEMDEVDYVVVGIGMNVNIALEDLDAPIRNTATSILIETGATLPRVRLIHGFLKSFERYYQIMQTDGFEAIRQRWKELASIMGRRVQVSMISKSLSGEVVDIDSDGVLILKDNQGELHRVVSGDVILT